MDNVVTLSPISNALHRPAEASLPLQLQEQDQDKDKPKKLTATQEQGAGVSASRTPSSTIILHYSPLKAVWDWIVLLLVIYIAVSTPYVAAFLAIQQSGFLLVLDLAVDVMFMADMIINFRTSFVRNGEVIVDAKLIAVNYLRGWFLIDAVSAIPFDFVLSMTGASDVRTCIIIVIFVVLTLLFFDVNIVVHMI